MADESRTTNVPDTDREGHSAEQAIMDARRAKAERLRARGENPFANDALPRLGGKTSDIGEVRARVERTRDAAGKYEESLVKDAARDQVFHVRGRVVALRSTGGLAFPR